MKVKCKRFELSKINNSNKNPYYGWPNWKLRVIHERGSNTVNFKTRADAIATKRHFARHGYEVDVNMQEYLLQQVKRLDKKIEKLLKISKRK